MDRGTLHRTLDNVFSHHLPSMILLKIYPEDITLLPFKGNTPWTVDVDAIALGHTMESMEVESGHMQIRQGFGMVQGVKAPQATHL
jgi:hypothetical protein